MNNELSDEYYVQAQAYATNSPEWLAYEKLGAIADLFGKNIRDVASCIQDYRVRWAQVPAMVEVLNKELQTIEKGN